MTKRIVKMDLAGFGELFGIAISANAALGQTELNLAEIHADRRNADMVLTDDGRVIHLEFQRRADPTMADRMLIYRSLLRVEPPYAGKRIQQHVIVLGGGTSPSRIEEPPDLQFAFETHYARDVDPVKAMARPRTAPWAILATARDDAERVARLIRILRLASSAESQFLANDLARYALGFASVVLERKIVERAAKESGMSAEMVEGIPWADELVNEGRLHATHDIIIELLRHRQVEGSRAELIASALLAEDQSTAASRAAFDELEQLIALIP